MPVSKTGSTLTDKSRQKNVENDSESALELTDTIASSVKVSFKLILHHDGLNKDNNVFLVFFEQCTHKKLKNQICYTTVR